MIRRVAELNMSRNFFFTGFVNREEGDRLVCERCGRRYPVRDGIPVMLIEEAELPADAPPGGPA